MVWSHFGARRYAKNWAIAQVKADLDARRLDPAHRGVAWDFYALRNAWNQDKPTVAPWWPENCKEAYASGIADAATALKNWSDSKNGTRKGTRVGFPRFESKHRARNRIRFTTGAIRVEPDRRTITLPRIGALHSKENTRRLHRLTRTGKARILNATLTERGGRLYVAFGCIVSPAASGPDPARRHRGCRPRAAGAGHGRRHRPAPSPSTRTRRPLRATLTRRRRIARQASRRIVGSRGHRAAKAKLAALDRRAVNLRKQAAHQFTTDLARSYGTVVVEDLDIAAMKRSMGRRAFRRARGGRGAGSGPADARPTRRPGMAGGWWWPTAGTPPPRSITGAGVAWSSRAGWPSTWRAR